MTSGRRFGGAGMRRGLRADGGDIVRAILVWGQSNAAGLGEHAELVDPDLVAPRPRSRLWASGSVHASVADRWAAVQPGYGMNVGYSGPELSLAQDLEPAFGRVVIIKHGFGGSSLANDWTHGQSRHSTALSSLASARAAYGPIELAGICWMQGESDSEVEADANAYETNLRNFITDIRTTHLGQPTLPFVVAKISTSPLWTHATAVRAAQAAVTDMANVDVIETSDLPRALDDAHYTMAGQVTLGERFAASLLGLMGL